MNLSSFDDFCARAESSGVLFYYTGEISPALVSAMGDTVRHRLETEAPDSQARRKVFSAFVEMAQNIVHYAAIPPDGRRLGALAVARSDERFHVLCGNPVRTEHVERLRARLDPLRSMSREQIRAAYREQLRNDNHEQDPISKGAGLGFLTLAREASAPIEYEILPRNGEPAFAEFYLRATL